ncbi:MAG TPA: hypothetical protein PKA64_07055 [Myxococcota bacterium]|nr:hypothetical protein [Myxococcota bacterium]
MVLLAWLAACHTAEDAPPADVTWHRDVRPIVERSCLDCHVEGGLAPFDLPWHAEDWADGAPPWAGAVVGAVEARRMPPWPADDACHPIAHSRALSDDEIARFTAWEANDYAVGDLASFAPLPGAPAPEPPGQPTLVLGFDAPFTPSAALPDDYRCLPAGPAFEADTWLRASRVAPGSQRTVHHVIAYLIPPEQVAAIEAADAAEDGPGYACWGGPVPDGGSASVLAGYVPGIAPEVLADGQARPLPAGARVVLQMHYNFGSAAPERDSTTLELWTQDEPPVEVVLTTGLANADFVIPAGDPSYTDSLEYGFGATAKVINVLGHMHQRGTHLRAEAVHPDGTTSCMLDLPRWDFAWQLFYAYPEDDPFWLDAADAVRLTCTWDNSAANQPTVNGVQLEPQDTRWGEGSADEMCIAYASYVVPGPGASGCEAIEACHGDACDPGDGACVAACWERSLSECGLCVAGGVLACGADACQAPGLTLSACLERDCGGLDTVPCLAGPCREPLEGYLSCQDLNVRAGVCDPRLEACGVAFRE